MALNSKIKELQERRGKLLLGGGEQAIEKQKALGKRIARERIMALLDEDSFNEYDLFVEHDARDFDMDKKSLPSDGVIIGSGTIYGAPVAIFAQDFTIAGGSLGLMHSRKITKIMDHALKMRMPLIGINDSGGAVYSPALTDFVFVVDNISKMFITCPEVIKTVLGEEISMEDLGGARVHSEITNNTHFFATPHAVLSFIPGTVLDIPVKPGQNVKKGDDLMILDAMKMQNQLKCTMDGKIRKILVNKGDKVSKGMVLLELE